MTVWSGDCNSNIFHANSIDAQPYCRFKPNVNFINPTETTHTHTHTHFLHVSLHFFPLQICQAKVNIDLVCAIYAIQLVVLLCIAQCALHASIHLCYSQQFANLFFLLIETIRIRCSLENRSDQIQSRIQMSMMTLKCSLRGFYSI